VLEKAHQRRPADREVLTALATYLGERGDARAALRYAEKLATLSPGDREVQGLADLLRRQAGSR
jgi:Flp pilus assembly protein TadD